ncbi:DUF5753 domain-containing protein [Streptomyces avermitilis]
MPGLLQTTEHARAVTHEAVPPMRPYEVEHRVSHRVKRQAVLFEGAPTPCTTNVHGAALRMGFGGPDTTRAQLGYLLETSEQPTITILVLPFGEAGFPATGLPGDLPKGAGTREQLSRRPRYWVRRTHLWTRMSPRIVLVAKSTVPSGWARALTTTPGTESSTGLPVSTSQARTISSAPAAKNSPVPSTLAVASVNTSVPVSIGGPTGDPVTAFHLRRRPSGSVETNPGSPAVGSA